MVYAVWASRGDPGRHGFWAARLARAITWADENIGVVVREARRLGAPAADEDLETYFSSCIGYRVGACEEEGLGRYLAEGGFLASEVYGRVSA
jgi:hypothetical protein